MTSARMQTYLAIEPTLPAKRLEVFRAVAAAGDRGATLDDVAASLAWPLHRISGRVTELARAGWVVPKGPRRRGQTVWARGDGRPKTIPGRGRWTSRGSVVATDVDISNCTVCIHVQLRPIPPFVPDVGQKIVVEWT